MAHRPEYGELIAARRRAALRHHRRQVPVQHRLRVAEGADPAETILQLTIGFADHRISLVSLRSPRRSPGGTGASAARGEGESPLLTPARTAFGRTTAPRR